MSYLSIGTSEALSAPKTSAYEVSSDHNKVDWEFELKCASDKCVGEAIGILIFAEMEVSELDNLVAILTHWMENGVLIS